MQGASAMDPLCERWRDRLDLRWVCAIRPAVQALQSLHPTRIDGLEHLPYEGALLVGNHGLLGYETPFFFERIFTTTGQMPLGLADHWFFRVPILRDLLIRMGGMYGATPTALRALRRGEWVVCYPGGAREVFKYSTMDRYRLRWEKSLGFVRVALRAGVPIVPFAAAGVDDTFQILARLRGTGQVLMGHDKYDLPLLLGLGPLPVPVPFWFRIGQPIVPEQRGRRVAQDEQYVRTLHQTIWQRTQCLLDELVSQWRSERSPLRRIDPALAQGSEHRKDALRCGY
jgi:1-acyl-sn-glycerol-3-phosphate acyltransferase